MLRHPVNTKVLKRLKRLLPEGNEELIDKNLLTLKRIDSRPLAESEDHLGWHGRVRLLEFDDKEGLHHKLVIKRCEYGVSAEETIKHAQKIVKEYNLANNSKGRNSVFIMPKAHVIHGKYLVQNYVNAINLGDLRNRKNSNKVKKMLSEALKLGSSYEDIDIEFRHILTKTDIAGINLFF